MSASSHVLVQSLAAVALIAASGCGPIPLDVSPAFVAGHWSRVDGLIPYRFSEDWNLSVSGKTISGSGDWSGEACCAGTLTVTGSFDADSIHLTVDLVTTSGAPEPPRQYRFDGTLFLPDELVGVATDPETGQMPEHLEKQK